MEAINGNECWGRSTWARCRNKSVRLVLKAFVDNSTRRPIKQPEINVFDLLSLYGGAKSLQFIFPQYAARTVSRVCSCRKAILLQIHNQIISSEIKAWRCNKSEISLRRTFMSLDDSITNMWSPSNLSSSGFSFFLFCRTSCLSLHERNFRARQID